MNFNTWKCKRYSGVPAKCDIIIVYSMASYVDRFVLS